MVNETDPRSVVYYVGSRLGGVVKIGTTVDVESRLRRLNRAQPSADLRVLAFERGGVNLERERHRHFAKSRQIGEWFWLTPDLRKHIESLGGAL